MAQRIIGVSKRLIEAAGQEFLKNGFENSSVRTIAQKAQTSPRAIYTRFENKEALFEAVINPAYSDFMELFKNDKILYWERARQRDFSFLPEEFYKKYLDFAYAHKEAFLLILKHSQGTRFQDFTRKLAQLDLQGVRENLPHIVKDFNTFYQEASTRLFLETITCSFYDALFSPLTEGVDLEVAKSYITKLTRFYADGIFAGLEKSAL